MKRVKSVFFKFGQLPFKFMGKKYISLKSTQKTKEKRVKKFFFDFFCQSSPYRIVNTNLVQTRGRKSCKYEPYS